MIWNDDTEETIGISREEKYGRSKITYVDIVLCKECGFAFYKEGLVPEGYIFCTKPGTERGQAVKPDDWFCADGKNARKVGDDMDREKVTYGLRCLCYGDVECKECPYAKDGSGWHDCRSNCAKDALALLQEQEAEIRQLRLALDIAKGTCKGIQSGGGQFADMPTMQSAT